MDFFFYCYTTNGSYVCPFGVLKTMLVSIQIRSTLADKCEGCGGQGRVSAAGVPVAVSAEAPCNRDHGNPFARRQRALDAIDNDFMFNI
eukprot:6173591-Pleurochrysis_carterae.AAC.5